MRQSFIHLKEQFEGFHYYPDAPDKVAFLKYRHRHLFKVDVHISVKENDRELEFFLVKEELKRACAALSIKQDNPGSCENMADDILTSLMKLYGQDRTYVVEVSEDGENGGVVRYTPTLTYA